MSASASADAPVGETVHEGVAESDATAAAAADKRPEASAFLKSMITIEVTQTGTAFTEENTRKLFDMYVVDGGDCLHPSDVRQLLLDVLDAFQWPLVVPDESLDAVFEEMSLNERGAITWVEFKSFFVFLHDRPLHKLFQLTSSGLPKEALATARLALFSVIEPVAEVSYNRTPFTEAAKALVAGADHVYVYFISANAVLALCLGPFGSPLLEAYTCETAIGHDSKQWNVSIKAFDPQKDVFPPTRRSGGFGSKMARKLADTYVSAQTWDREHFKVAETTKKLVRRASAKLQQIDADYKVSETIEETAAKAAAAVKGFDDKHEISARVKATAAGIDERYDISAKADSAMRKIRENETVKSVTASVTGFLASSKATVDQVTSETKQLVIEKERELAKADDSEMASAAASQVVGDRAEAEVAAATAVDSVTSGAIVSQMDDAPDDAFVDDEEDDAGEVDTA